MNSRHFSVRFLVQLAAVILMVATESRAAAQLFIAVNGDTVGEYSTSGTPINSSLITGLDNLSGVTVSGSDLFTLGSGTVGEYTLSGTPVNASLITGLNQPNTAPWGIASSGSDLFIGIQGTNTIEEYTTSGTLVNPSLISLRFTPQEMVIVGSDLFVTTEAGISEYTTSGAVVSSQLVNDVNNPVGLAISGNDIFVANSANGTVGEYTTSGQTINASLISGLSNPLGIAVVGSNLFVSEGGTLDEYTTSGEFEGTSLISDEPISDMTAVAAAPEPSPWSELLVGGVFTALFLRRRATLSR